MCQIGPMISREPLTPYDLKEQILAKSPPTSNLGHWLATCLINRPQEPINYVGDIMHIRNTRSTSWEWDKTKIGNLLMGAPGTTLDGSELEMTKDILVHLGKIPSFSLIHGEATMKYDGAWSWCIRGWLACPLYHP